MSIFSALPDFDSNKAVIGPDFDVMKRNPIHESFVGYDQKVFKYRHDRLIPTRSDTTSEFLRKSKTNYFDVSSAENNIKVIRKVHYQNHLRKLFLEKEGDNKQQSEEIKLIHADWACKVPHIRLKFLPDFETVRKPCFGRIYDYVWSKKQIIAAASNRKVCLYYPFNGFTRALDITGRVCIAFSNSGDYLAIAYKKSTLSKGKHDLYIFKINHQSLLESDDLDTEKLRTSTDYDITAIQYSRNDEFLMCGTNVGKILVLKCTAQMNPNPTSTNTIPIKTWELVTTLTSEHHKKPIKKISFSCNFRYMATLDSKGQLSIWNGSSWNLLFWIQPEKSSDYKFLEWHPFVEEELILGKSKYPSLFLINVVQKEIVASYMNWKEDMEITSIAFNPVTAQLAVCFYIREEFINRVSILASMSQVINTFDFDYIYGGLKLIWNASGSMLGAGAQTFRFAFWSCQKNNEFPLRIKGSASKNPALITLNDSKLSSLR